MVLSDGEEVLWLSESECLTSYSNDVLALAVVKTETDKAKTRRKNPLPFTADLEKISKGVQPEHRLKYESLKKKEIVHAYILHKEIMELLGVDKKIRRIFDNIGWGIWLKWSPN